MIYKIVIRNSAHADIFDIGEYIYRTSFSKEISEKIVNNLYKSIFSLEFSPNRFEKYSGNYRRIIVGNSYKIIYKVDEKK